MSDPEDLLELIHAARRIRIVRFTVTWLGREYLVHVLDGKARVEGRSNGAVTIGAGRRWRHRAADGHGEELAAPPFDPALVLGTPALLSCELEVLGHGTVAGRPAHHVRATPFRWVPSGGGPMVQDRAAELWLDADRGVALRGDWGGVTSIAFDEPLAPSLIADPIAGDVIIDRRDPGLRPTTLDDVRAAISFPLLTPGLLPEGAHLAGSGVVPDGSWIELRYAVPPGGVYMLVVRQWRAGGPTPRGVWTTGWSRERHGGVDVDVIPSADNNVRVERAEVMAMVSSALPVGLLARVAGSLRFE